MNRPRVLIVDDDPAILRFVRANLSTEGYEVFTAMDGVEALETIERELPDLVILDIMLPRMDGFEVCRQLREWSPMPVIMLSARGDEEDKVKCLDLGADDYMSKPFGVRELLARIKAVLRRTESVRAAPTQLSFTSAGGDLEINFGARQVTVSGSEVRLTATEYALLQEFVLNVGKVLTHAHLLNKVWGPEYRDERKYLQVFVYRLRAGVERDPDDPRHILTVHGVGYRFVA